MNDILVVIDCQNDFISGSLKNEEAAKAIPNIVAKIKNFKGGTILVTKDTHFNDYLSTKEGRRLPVEHCIKGTDGWKLNADVKKALDNAVTVGKTVKFIEKNTFGSLNLMEEIRYALRDLEWENYVTSKIEFVGFCTDICVVSNALLAKTEFYDTNIVVDAECCAGVTPESHFAALNTMKMCQIDVINENI